MLPNIKKLKNKNLLIFLLSITIFFFPLQNFILNNLYELSNKNILQILTYNFIFYIIVLIGSYSLSKLTKINLLDFTLILSSLFWILFNYTNIREAIFNYNKNLASEISLLVILLIFIIFYKIFIKQKKKLITFLCLFFLLQYFYSGVVYYQNYRNYDSNKTSFNNAKLISNDQIKNSLKKKNTKNIYYVIVDEMTSINEFNSLFGAKLTKEELINDSEEFIYFDDYSSFNTTTLTIASIFHLDRIVKVGDDVSKYNHSKILFPKNLSKNNLITSQEPRLVRLLNNINYNFKWVGNNWGNCKNINKDLCLNTKLSQKKNFDLINLYILNSFFKPTPFEVILLKVIDIFQPESNYILGNDFIENDAINKFLSFNFKPKSDQRYFFFIHHMMPHSPYIFNSDCTYDGSLKNNVPEKLNGYKNNFFCTILRINQFLDFIKKNDPEAIVVIQGDHGFRNDKTFTSKNDTRKFKIFNFLKLSRECNENLENQNKLGNINSIRVALNCALNIDLKLIDNYPVLSNKINKNFGVVEKAIIK